MFACLFANNFVFELAQCCSASCEKSVGQKQWRHTLNITTRKPESITDMSMSMYITSHVVVADYEAFQNISNYLMHPDALPLFANAARFCIWFF